MTKIYNLTKELNDIKNDEEGIIEFEKKFFVYIGENTLLYRKEVSEILSMHKNNSKSELINMAYIAYTQRFCFEYLIFNNLQHLNSFLRNWENRGRIGKV